MFDKRISDFLIASCVIYVFSSLLIVDIAQTLLDPKNPKCVFEVGANLTRRLTDHPCGNKEDLINDLTDYYIYLNTAFRVESESHPKGKQMLQKLIARGGPPMLSVDVSDGLLEDKYDMGVVEVDHIKEIIQDIQQLWRDIKNGTLVSPEFENY